MTSFSISEWNNEKPEQFLSDFNRLENFLRKELGAQDSESFSKLARNFAEQKGSWKPNLDFVLTCAKIRNMIVHRRTSEEFLAAIPHSTTVAMLRSIVDNLLSPTTVGSLFQKEVVQFSTGDPIVKLLQPVIQDAFSFFPVRNACGFSGMLTGNGVMRWIADQAQSTSTIDISEVTVGQVLQLEEGRGNHKFISLTMDVDDAAYMFFEIPELEALFITDSGDESEELRGMMTVWDVVRLRRD